MYEQNRIPARLARAEALVRGKALLAAAGLSWRAADPPDPDGPGEALRLNLVQVREETAPEGAERLEWFLLARARSGLQFKTHAGTKPFGTLDTAYRLP